MSKKTITGKALAAFLASAVCSSMMAAPAFAADLITLSSTTGTNNALLGSSVVLQSSVDATINGAAENKLMYSVSNPSAATVSAKFSTGTAAPVSVDLGVGTSTTRVGNTSNASTFVIDPTSVVDNAVAPDPSDFTYTNPLTNKLAVNNLELTLTGSATASVDVFAFVDSNGNKTFDANIEHASATRTLKFVKNSEVTGNTSLTTPLMGDTKLSASVTLGDSLTASNLNGAVTVQFSKDGVAQGSPVTATYDSTKSMLIAERAQSVVAGAYTAQAYLNGVALGTPATWVVAAGTAATIDTPTVSTTNDIRTGGFGEATYVARSGIKSVPVSLKVRDAQGTVVGAGVSVALTVTRNSLDATSTVGLGDKTLTSTTTGGAMSYTAKTDANGQVMLSLTSNTGKAGDKVTVSASTSGVSTLVTATPVSIEWKDAAAANVVDLGLVGINAERTLVRGGTASFTYGVADEFGRSVADSTYRMAITLTSVTSGATFTAFPAVTAGRATVALTDNSTSAGSYVVSAVLQKLNTANGNYEATATPVTASKVNVTAAAVTPVVTLNATASTGLALEGKAFAAVDRRLDKSTSAPSYTAVTTLSGSTGVAGSAVTLSAKGLAFASGDLYTLDSITVNADASGNYSGVTVYSHTSGDITVTATVASVSATKVLTWVNGAAAHINISAPVRAQTGRSLDITATITDSFGNPVANAAAGTVKFDLTGVATFANFANSVTSGTDKNGVATVKLIAGQNDLGNTVIAVSLPGNTNLAAVTKTVQFGTADATLTYSKGKMTLTYSFAAGQKIRVVLNGKTSYTVVPTADDDGKKVFTIKKHKKAVKNTASVRIWGMVSDSVAFKR